MKRLALLLCLLPLAAAAQTLPATTPMLIRTYDGGADCYRYPGSFNKPNVSGAAQLTYTVKDDGTVTGVAITSSAGDIQLDRGATDCARSWKFLPPQKDGQPTSLTATAIVTYAADDRGRFRNATMHWNAPGVREAAGVASSDIHHQAVQCLRVQPALADAAARARYPSRLRAFFSSGEIRRVTVTASSGDDALDKAAAACYSAVPKNPERAKYLAYTVDADFALPWAQLYPQGAH